MNTFISIYIISGILSFALTVYAQYCENDVTVDHIINFLFISLLPVFNTLVMILFTVCTIHDHYVEGGFVFLNKVVLKRKAKS